jgi:hypothetical protein
MAAVTVRHTAAVERLGRNAESKAQQDCCQQSQNIFNFFHPVSSFFSPAARPSFII